MQCASASCSWIPTQACVKLRNSKAKLTTETYYYTCFDNTGGGGGGGGGGGAAAAAGHVKSIASTSNPFVKHCLKLQQNSSYRHSHASALVVGSTPIREIYRSQDSLQKRTVELEYLLLLDKTEVSQVLDDKSSARVVRVSSVVMKKLSQLQSTESVDAIALMKFPTTYFVVDNHQDCSRKWFPSPHRILVLDGIQMMKTMQFEECHGCIHSLPAHECYSLQDPGNLGTLLRSALAFRWGGVFLLPGCCDPFNSKTLRASRGASFQIPIVSGSWYHLEALKDEYQMKMFAGHPDCNDKSRSVSHLSQGLADCFARVPLCLVLGSEGHGLSEKAHRECELLSIPMAGEFESLNVAVAGGIFLYMLQPKNQKIV